MFSATPAPEKESLSSAYREISGRLKRGSRSETNDDLQIDADWVLARGHETRRADYSWNGLARHADPDHPYLVFQCCLDGAGAFEVGGKTQSLLPGHAFFAFVPSAHCYFLPRESPFWTFFWVTIQHPYVVTRLRAALDSPGAVFFIAPDSRLMARSLGLWEQISSRAARDSLGCEQALFDWMFETERFCRALLHPQSERERWLETARHAVLSDLQNSCPVEKLAAEAGLSRSHYSHLFKAATGISPAAWVSQIRLEEVARRLRHSDDKLQKIALQTGYGDANHLCKVFRRFFHLSPNQFRRQIK